MEILCKVGPKRHNSDPNQQFDWLDGHIVSGGANGAFTATMDRRHFCVIETPYIFADWCDAAGCLDLTNEYGLFAKQVMTPKIEGKYPWDFGYAAPDGFGSYMMRDWFVDFKYLYDTGLITLAQYISIYDKSADQQRIYIDADPRTYIFNESEHTRRPTDGLVDILPGTIDAAGTYTVGTGQTYSNWQVAIADLPADLGAMTTPGDVILQGNTDEELPATTGNAIVSLDTDSYTLTLNAASGVKHNGTYSGHRIQFGAYDTIEFDEAITGTLNNVVVQDLAVKAAGNNAYCFQSDDGFVGVGNGLILERCVADLDGRGRTFYYHSDNGTGVDKVTVRNNIVYNGATLAGINFVNPLYFGADHKVYVYNNTIIGCVIGINVAQQIDGGVFEIRNNLCYGNTTDYSNATYAWLNVTTSKNVSGDTTSPDGATYQSWSNTSAFSDYAGNDFTIGSSDTTLDDGDNLSAVGSPQQFLDDIQDQTRSDWYIGASEFISGTSPIEQSVSGIIPASTGSLTRTISYKRTLTGEI